MDDARLVRRFQRFGDLSAMVSDSSSGIGPRASRCDKSRLDQFHHERIAAVGVL